MIKVIYHNNCYDGFTAAWICKQALPEASFIPATYGDPIPEFSEDDEVYIVDFSYPRDVLEDIHQKVKKLLVLDHHKTAQAALDGLSYCTFDMNRSGAGLAWDHFFPHSPRLRLVNYVQDRDLWRFDLEHCKEVHAYISSYPMTFKQWDLTSTMLETILDHCVENGAAILRYMDQKVDEVIKNGLQWRKVGGYEIPCVNVPYHMGSDVGHRLLDLYPQAPFSGYYLFTNKFDEQWGLRGRDSDDFDVSIIAKQYGGGGHKKASGFLMNRSTRG